MPCCIRNCSGKEELKALPGATEQPERRAIWMKYCTARAKQIKFPRICMRHFSASQVIVISGKTYLKATAVPDINLPKLSDVGEQSSLEADVTEGFCQGNVDEQPRPGPSAEFSSFDSKPPDTVLSDVGEQSSLEADVTEGFCHGNVDEQPRSGPSAEFSSYDSKPPDTALSDVGEPSSMEADVTQGFCHENVDSPTKPGPSTELSSFDSKPLDSVLSSVGVPSTLEADVTEGFCQGNVDEQPRPGPSVELSSYDSKPPDTATPHAIGDSTLVDHTPETRSTRATTTVSGQKRSRKRTRTSSWTPMSKRAHRQSLSAARNRRRIYLPEETFKEVQQVCHLYNTRQPKIAISRLCKMVLASRHHRSSEATPVRPPTHQTPSSSATVEPSANLDAWLSPQVLVTRRDSEDELQFDDFDDSELQSGAEEEEGEQDDDAHSPGVEEEEQYDAERLPGVDDEELDEDDDERPPGVEEEEGEQEEYRHPGDDSDSRQESVSHWQVKSAVITETCLTELLHKTLVRCPKCARRSEAAVSRTGMTFHVKWVCSACTSTTDSWTSTVKEGQIYHIDVLFAGALLMSGNHYAKIAKLFQFMNLGVVNASTYHKLGDIVRPVVIQKKEEVLNKNCDMARRMSPEGLVVAGDCQNDSPGHSAAYGTYTVVDTVTNRIIAQETVFRSETGYNSPQLEVVGASRCVDNLTNTRNLAIREFVSDQHMGVRKKIKELLPEAEFSLDVWHAAKNLSKDLRQAATRRGCVRLAAWVPSIKNHFWHCAETAHGSKEHFMKNWTMCLHHVCGDHGLGHPDGGEAILTTCQHEKLTEEQKRQDQARLLKKGDPAQEALRSVVFSTKTMKRVEGVLRFRHTGSLENYHSTSLAYTTKRVFFDPPMFMARKAMSVIDYDAHIGRPQQEDSSGQRKFSTKYSRTQKKLVLVKRKVDKTYPYVRAMLQAMLDARRVTPLSTSASELEAGDPRVSGAYVNPIGHASAEEKERLIAEQAKHSRFK